jgi:hypothetical protein
MSSFDLFLDLKTRHYLLLAYPAAITGLAFSLRQQASDFWFFLLSGLLFTLFTSYVMAHARTLDRQGRKERCEGELARLDRVDVDRHDWNRIMRAYPTFRPAFILLALWTIPLVYSLGWSVWRLGTVRGPLLFEVGIFLLIAALARQLFAKLLGSFSERRIGR